MSKSHDPLFAEERRKHPWIGFLLLLIVFIAATMAVVNGINNSRINLLRETVTVPSLPSSLESFRILHISDLHGLYFGQHQEQLKAALGSARYDIVCVTGDITGPDGDMGAFVEMMKLFKDKPVYFIPGDEDPAPILATPHGTLNAKADYILEAERTGAVYLDAPVKITRGKNALWLAPEWIYAIDYEASDTAYHKRLAELQAEEPSPEREAALLAVNYQINQLIRIRQARRETLETDVHVALTHHPLQTEALQALQEWTATDNDSYIRSISLVLAGHYVGGQWRVPGVGAVRAPLSAGTGNNGWFPDDKQIMGLSNMMGIPQYISPGLGTSAAIDLPPIRVFNTPAVTILTLTGRLTM
ncbi:MAG: metallophosphoesterase [Clostridia bacterium]|nr:metallophosphoesterase [Clostridia bacterium]